MAKAGSLKCLLTPRARGKGPLLPSKAYSIFLNFVKLNGKQEIPVSNFPPVSICLSWVKMEKKNKFPYNRNPPPWAIQEAINQIQGNPACVTLLKDQRGGKSRSYFSLKKTIRFDRTTFGMELHESRNGDKDPRGQRCNGYTPGVGQFFAYKHVYHLRNLIISL